MANVTALNTTTFANATSVSTKVIGEVFSKLLMVSSAVKDVFGQMEGPEGSRKPILVKTDLSKGGSQYVNFTVSANAGHFPRRGEQELSGTEEKPRINSFQVKIDIIRHSISFNLKVKMFLAAGKSLDEAYAEVLSDHWARFKETDVKMTLRQKAGADNKVYPNNKGSIDLLTSSDVVNTKLLSQILGKLTMLGAKEIKINKSKAGADVLRYLIFGTFNALQPLKSNATYAAAVQSTHITGNNNVIFDGGFTDWDGQGIYAQPIVDPDAEGPIGDPLEPRGLLGTAITAGTAAFDIEFGGALGPDSTGNAKYSRWFLGYDYPWTEGQTAAPDSSTYYVIVYNTTGVDAGKFGVYSYLGTGNNGSRLTAANRLGSAASGIRVTSLAGQTWSSSVHTDAHPVGSMIIQVNAKCVPITWLLGLGVGAALRAYGDTPMERIAQDHDYKFNKGMGYMSVFGQDVAKDSQSIARGYALCPVVYEIPGISLPVVA